MIDVVVVVDVIIVVDVVVVVVVGGEQSTDVELRIIAAIC